MMPSSERRRLSRRRLLACGVTTLGTGLAGCSMLFDSDGITTLRPVAVHNDGSELELMYDHDGERIAEFTVSRGEIRGRDVRLVPFTCSLAHLPDDFQVTTLGCILGTRWLTETEAPPPELSLPPHPNEDWPPVTFTSEEPGRATFETLDPVLSDGSTQFRIHVVCPLAAPGEFTIMVRLELESDDRGTLHLLGEDVLDLPSTDDIDPS